MSSTGFPKVRLDNVIIQELNDELLIYDSTTHKAYCLNQGASLIWQACDGRNSVPEIREKLSSTLKSPVTDDFVWLALDQLKKNDLLENSNELKIDFGGLSRREVMRKLGFASMIALPMIAGLVAPTAAQAASCTPSRGTCTLPRPDLCCSLCCTTEGAPPGMAICC